MVTVPGPRIDCKVQEMAVFPLHRRPLSPGPRQLTGKFKTLTSQVKASPHLLLELWASALSYGSRRPRRMVWAVTVVVLLAWLSWSQTSTKSGLAGRFQLMYWLFPIGVGTWNALFRQILRLCCCYYYYQYYYENYYPESVIIDLWYLPWAQAGGMMESMLFLPFLKQMRRGKSYNAQAARIFSEPKKKIKREKERSDSETEYLNAGTVPQSWCMCSLHVPS